MPESPDQIKKRVQDHAPAGDRDAVAEVAALRGRVFEKLHANLIPQASAELEWLTNSSGLSRTDVVNRALQVYGYLERQKADGFELLLGKNGGLEKLHIV